MSSIAIEFGGYQPPASIHNRAAEFFCQHLAGELGDEVRLSLDGNIMESGHNAADLLTMVEGGKKSLCYFSTSYLVDRVPEFALFDLPFLIRDREQAYAALDGPLGHMLADQLAASSGFKLLGLWDNGFRHFTNRLRPIQKPEDCKDLRIRTLFNSLHGEVFRLLGFEPIELDVKDLIASVLGESIDAQENPLTNTYNFGIHKHHRHITLSGHFFGVAGFLCHNDSYQCWPAHVQHAAIEAASAATAYQRGLAAVEDAEILPLLEQADMEIVRLSDAERGLFVDAVTPIINDQRGKLADDLLDQLG